MLPSDVKVGGATWPLSLAGLDKRTDAGGEERSVMASASMVTLR